MEKQTLELGFEGHILHEVKYMKTDLEDLGNSRAGGG